MEQQLSTPPPIVSTSVKLVIGLFFATLGVVTERVRGRSGAGRRARFDADFSRRQDRCDIDLGFVRIQRSYVLNIERIDKIELYAKESRVAILRDGSRLPVSRSGYATLRELLWRKNVIAACRGRG